MASIVVQEQDPFFEFDFGNKTTEQIEFVNNSSINKMAKKKTFKVLDLFCGCGGLSKGFEMAGYDILLGVDFNEPALKTYAYNHHGSKTLCGDLSTPETFDKIDRLLDGKKIDVIIGGPPCQGFSLTGPRQFDDERNKLYLA